MMTSIPAPFDAPLRAIEILALVVAPWRAPLEPAPASSIFVVAAALVGFALASVMALRATRRDRIARHLVGTAIGAVIAAALIFSGRAGPLARALPIVSPLVWAAIGAVILARVPWARRRAIGVAVGVAAAVAVNGVAIARGAFAHVRWVEATLRAWPGDPVAAVERARSLDAAGDGSSATQTLLACVRAAPTSCECAHVGRAIALENGDFVRSLEIVERAAPSCVDAATEGVRAEALAGAGRCDEAFSGVARALATDPQQPNALYASAVCAHRAGAADVAASFAERAVVAGRGPVAHLLHALVLIETNKLDAARIELLAVVTARPRDVAALYDLGLVAQKLGHYGEARTRYLDALRIQPDLPDARYNLYILTRDAGVVGEAKHHLDELARIRPDDPRLATARSGLLRAGASKVPVRSVP